MSTKHYFYLGLYEDLFNRRLSTDIEMAIFFHRGIKKLSPATKFQIMDRSSEDFFISGKKPTVGDIQCNVPKTSQCGEGLTNQKVIVMVAYLTSYTHYIYVILCLYLIYIIMYNYYTKY